MGKSNGKSVVGMLSFLLDGIETKCCCGGFKGFQS